MRVPIAPRTYAVPRATAVTTPPGDVTVAMAKSELDQTIVATVDAQWKLRFMGHAIDERVLLSDVWVKTEEGWQVVRRHSSPVPAGVSIE